MADNCVFCRIVKGEIPSQKVFEDDRYLAFLDIGPLARGHTLVLPKEHAETLTDLSAETLSGLALRAQQIARAVVRATGAQGFNLLMNNGRCSGQAVPHAHWHIIPRREGDGIGFNWPAGKYATGEAEKVAVAIRESFGRS